MRRVLRKIMRRGHKYADNNAGNGIAHTADKILSIETPYLCPRHFFEEKLIFSLNVFVVHNVVSIHATLLERRHRTVLRNATVFQISELPSLSIFYPAPPVLLLRGR